MTPNWNYSGATITVWMNDYANVIVHPGRDRIGLNTDQMRIDVDHYEMKVDVGMLLMHPKCPNILPNWMVPKVLDRTMYGRPPKCKRFLRKDRRKVVRHIRVSGLSIAAFHLPRARMEMRGPGPNRLRELRSSPFEYRFSRSRLNDRLPLPILRPAHIPPGAIRSLAAQATGAGSR